jgi:hypothetical protein
VAVQQLFTSRIRTANSSSYIGENGRMFYDEALGELRLSNGVTPGGTPITVVANVVTSGSLLPTADNQFSIGTGALRWNHLHLDSAYDSIYFSANTLGMDNSGYLSYNSGTGNVAFGNIKFNNGAVQSVAYTPGTISSNLIPAADNTISLGSATYRYSNLYLGYQGLFLADTGTNQNINITANAGTLYLDGVQNLRIGNLVIVDTTLTSATNNLDISIGDTNDTGFFYVKRKAQFDNTTWGATEAMVSINGSGTADPDTVFPDTILQTTSRPNKTSRVIQRGYGSTGNVGGDNSYAVWGSYAARGNVSNPSAIKANDILSRISSNGYGTTTWGSGGTRIESVALENFTDSAKGSRINFWTTPAGTIISQQVASITSAGITANSITFNTDNTTQTTAGIPLTQLATANGVATLGIDGRLTSAQIPSSLTGAITFQGGWNAANNTPTLANGTGTTGYQYIVTTPGNRNLGAGNVAYAAGDTITYGANVWNYVQATSPISSVSGNLHMQVSPTTGAVTVGIDATPNAVAGTVVSRDASGNFQANTITAALSGQATSAITAATVTAGSQTAITQVGTLTSLAVSGNVTTGNISGTAHTGTTAIFSGNVTAGNLSGTLTTAAQTNITSVGTLGSLAVTGNVTAGNLSGTLTTAAQTNITSVGTLGSLAVSGNVTTAGKATANQILANTVVVNTGGIRTVAGGTPTINLNFGTDSIIHVYQPAGTVTFQYGTLLAGASIRCIVNFATHRNVVLGVSASNNTNLAGKTAIGGAGNAANATDNAMADFYYTCVDGTAANTYCIVNYT